MNDLDILDELLDDIVTATSDTFSFVRSHRRDPIIHRRGRRRRPSAFRRLLRRV